MTESHSSSDIRMIKLSGNAGVVHENIDLLIFLYHSVYRILRFARCGHRIELLLNEHLWRGLSSLLRLLLPRDEYR